MTGVEEKVMQFFARYPLREYSRGEVLVQAGAHPPVFYIESGVVVQRDIAENGAAVTLNMLKKGAFFSMPNVLNDTPALFRFEAYDAVSVRQAPAEEVKQFIHNNPEVMFDLLQRISRGTDGLLKRMARQMGGSAGERIVQEITILQARIGTEKGIKMTEADLAAQTGLARETVSRELKRLRDKATIVQNHGYLRIDR